MKSKYSVGNKVRIRARNFHERIIDSGMSRYDNMVGEIVEATSVVAFIAPLQVGQMNQDQRVTIYHYTIKVSDDVTLYNVLEDFLEISE